MLARGGYLQRLFRGFLPLHIRKIKRSIAVDGEKIVFVEYHRYQPVGIGEEVVDKLADILYRINSYAVCGGCFAGIVRRAEHILEPGIPCGNSHRQRPCDRSQVAGKRKLAEKAALCEIYARHSGKIEQRKEYRKVVHGAFLLYVRRGKVYRYNTLFEWEIAGSCGAADSAGRFFYCRIGQPDDIKTRLGGINVRSLDGNYLADNTAYCRRIYPAYSQNTCLLKIPQDPSYHEVTPFSISILHFSAIYCILRRRATQDLALCARTGKKIVFCSLHSGKRVVYCFCMIIYTGGF